MDTTIALALAAVVILIFVVLVFFVAHKEKIQFFAEGSTKGFRRQEIQTLWKTAEKCGISTPSLLYDSVPLLNKCIAMIQSETRRNGTAEREDIKQLLSSLNVFRRHLALKTTEHGKLKDSHELELGQRLSIIFKGKGIFSSRVLATGRQLVISFPVQPRKLFRGPPLELPSTEWIGKRVSVYAGLSGDACYVFDSLVESAGESGGKRCLNLQHSARIDRMQKRSSIRCSCRINAQMYVIKSKLIDYSIKEGESGSACMLEDLSEGGALIRIGGKGRQGVQVKLAFNLNSVPVLMLGVIRAVEYNRGIRQSRLHFECTYIENDMKEALVRYIYENASESARNAVPSSGGDTAAHTDDDGFESADTEDKAPENSGF